MKINLILLVIPNAAAVYLLSITDHIVSLVDFSLCEVFRAYALERAKFNAPNFHHAVSSMIVQSIVPVSARWRRTRAALAGVIVL